jgi:hypothetical protein
MRLNSMDLPDALFEEARVMAESAQVSLEEWISGGMADGRSLTIAQKVEWEKTRGVFRRYAAKADVARFDALMARVPDVEPMPGDELL